MRYLAHRYSIPLDRAHIIGHDNVQGTTAGGVAAMHTDPGPYWDWNHYMALVRGESTAPARRAHGTPRIVTIDPDFATNTPPVTGQPTQSANIVYLHTEPDASSPLLSDPALHPSGGAGTEGIDDWGDRAAAGQQFAVAGRSGDWLGVWFGGQVGWIHDPAGHPVTRPSHGTLITPRGDAAPTYGRAYPEASAYPSQIPAQPISPLQYTLKSGQRYVAYDEVDPDYYYAKTIDDSLPMDHTDVTGHDKYYLIQLGHRIGYVRAADVTVVH